MSGDGSRWYLEHYGILDESPVPDNLDEVVDEDDKYTCIGESHADVQVAGNILLPLLDTGEYDAVFLEALARGDYSDEGDQLKHASDSFTYQLRPDKYDAILRAAGEQGIDVHGIDAHGKRRERDEVQDWAEYIRENSGERNLVLIGNLHLNYPWETRQDSGNLPEHLMRQGEDSIITLSTGSPADLPADVYRQDIGPGLYHVEELLEDPLIDKKDRIADFLYAQPI